MNEKETMNDESNKITQLFNISMEILNKLTVIDDKLNKFEDRILNIEKKLDLNVLLLLDGGEIEDLKELKRENLEIDKKDIMKALSYKDYRSVLNIFRHYYKNKNNKKYAYPIRISGKRSYEYYDNKKWNSDLYGYHSMNTIMLNIQDLFIKNNILDDIDDNNEFFLNQVFIMKLSDDKYKKEVFKHIVEEVRINNI
jgi:hypothetical protein